MVVGNLVSVAAVFTLTKRMTDQTYAFLLLGSMQLVWILMIVPTRLIAEPKVMDAREEKKINKKSFCGKIYSVLKQTLQACKQDHALAIGLIAVSISRIGTMVQTTTFLIWIKSFPGFTQTEQTNLWQEQNLITNLCAIPIIIFTGRSCDKISAKILIPACILF